MSNKDIKLSTKIGRKIKLERTKRDWSQESLAELADLNTNSIGAIERGNSSPSIDTLDKIAKAFGIDIIELIKTDKVDL